MDLAKLVSQPGKFQRNQVEGCFSLSTSGCTPLHSFSLPIELTCRRVTLCQMRKSRSFHWISVYIKQVLLICLAFSFGLGGWTDSSSNKSIIFKQETTCRQISNMEPWHVPCVSRNSGHSRRRFKLTGIFVLSMTSQPQSNL